MSRHRSAEYDKRDLLFVHTCETCARASRCTFKSSPEGPEAVCRQLIEFGNCTCEYCVRRNRDRGCVFTCVFYVPKPKAAASVVEVGKSLA